MTDWYFIGAGGKKIGPVTREILLSSSQSGEINIDTLVWKEGLDDWVKFKDFPKIEDGSLKLEYSCPKCKSDNAQKVEVLYNSGITNIATKTGVIGAGISGGGMGMGVGGAMTKGTLRTQLTELLEPPKGDRPTERIVAKGSAVAAILFGGAWFLLLLIIGVVMGGGIVGFALILLWMGGGFGIIYFAFKGSTKRAFEAADYNKMVYPKELERWERDRFEWKRKCICLRCGTVFIPS